MQPFLIAPKLPRLNVCPKSPRLLSMVIMSRLSLTCDCGKAKAVMVSCHFRPVRPSISSHHPCFFRVLCPLSVRRPLPRRQPPVRGFEEEIEAFRPAECEARWGARWKCKNVPTKRHAVLNVILQAHVDELSCFSADQQPMVRLLVCLLASSAAMSCAGHRTRRQPGSVSPCHQRGRSSKRDPVVPCQRLALQSKSREPCPRLSLTPRPLLLTKCALALTVSGLS